MSLKEGKIRIKISFKKLLTTIGSVIIVVFFLIGSIYIIDKTFSNTNKTLDPIIQYNQSDIPYVAYGGTPFGNYNDLNVSGEGLTYDVPEAQDGATNITIFHATFDGWSTAANCGNSATEGWSECQLGEATLYWRAVAGTVSYNASSTQYHEGNDIDTGNATWITKCSDLSSYIKAYVTFWYNKTSTNGANERQFILFNKTGAGAFTSLWGSTTSATAWTYQDLNITDHISSYTCIRYMAGAASAGTERLRLDDFKIIGTKPLHRVDVWHNSSQIADGIIFSINTTINFTTNVSDSYSLQIYDFANSQWILSGCDFGDVLADTPTNWWCNITTNPMNYNSSDRVIRIRINSTAHADPALLREDYVQYYIGYQAGYLEVNLTNPEPSFTTNVAQNYTFPINATVTCRNGPCGEIKGTIRYNLSSSNPDIPINETFGDIPLFIQETPSYSLKSCGILYEDQTCQLDWMVNATGDIGTSWKIGVLFNSSYPEIQQNHTDNVTISITTCMEDIELAWTSIDFGQLTPSLNHNNATNNDKKIYNITNKGICPLTLWIKGTDLENSTYGSRINVGNLSWSNTTNDYTNSYNMTYSYVILSPILSPKENLTTYYWLFVPPIYSGYYTGSVYICGNTSSAC